MNRPMACCAVVLGLVGCAQSGGETGAESAALVSTHYASEDRYLDAELHGLEGGGVRLVVEHGDRFDARAIEVELRESSDGLDALRSVDAALLRDAREAALHELELTDGGLDGYERLLVDLLAPPEAPGVATEALRVRDEDASHDACINGCNSRHCPNRRACDDVDVASRCRDLCDCIRDSGSLGCLRIPLPPGHVY